MLAFVYKFSKHDHNIIVICFLYIYLTIKNRSQKTMLTCNINCCIKSNRHCNVRLKRLITGISELPEKRFRYPWEIQVIFTALFWSLKHAGLFNTTHSFQHHSKTDNLYFLCLTVRNIRKRTQGWKVYDFVLMVLFLQTEVSHVPALTKVFALSDCSYLWVEKLRIWWEIRLCG